VVDYLVIPLLIRTINGLISADRNNLGHSTAYNQQIVTT